MGSVKESSSEYTSDNTSQYSDTSSNISLDIAEKSKKKIIIKIPSKNTSSTKNKKASEIYKKMEHAEHIYKKPDTYVGSCEQEDSESFVYTNDTNNNVIQKKHIKYL